MIKSRTRLASLPVALCIALMGLPLQAGELDLLGIEHDAGNVYAISMLDATPVWLGSTGIPGFSSLEFAPDGTLYGFTNLTDARLYVIDPVSFSATEVGPLGTDFLFEGSLAFSPDGMAYGTNNDGEANPQLLTLDLLTGEASIVGTITGGRHDINGMAWRSDGMLIGLDRVTNSFLQIDPSNANSMPLAPAIPLAGAVGGMAAVGDDTAYFVTGGPGASLPGSNELWELDLLTGQHTPVGSLSPTITGSGLSGLAVPEPASLVLLIAGAFVVVRRRGLTS